MRLMRINSGQQAPMAAARPLTRFVGRVTTSTEVTDPTPLPVTPPARAVRPVLLVHGLRGLTSGWYEVAGALRARGETVVMLSYRPFAQTVEEVAERLADTVGTLLDDTGADKVHLVGHSLGGVVIAQAFADGMLTGQVDTVVTVASPFGGSPWASLLPVGATVRSLRGGSPLLRRLAVAPAPEGVSWLAISATSDLIVPGRRSVPPQSTVVNLAVDGIGHRGLLQDPQVVTSIVDALPTYDLVAA